MLELKHIVKDYIAGSATVRALNDVNLSFRKTDFVSILGPSGCGKTTLLNIIGGLDRYTSGDLIVNGKSTKEFGDKDWDAYRNDCIGFVFQTYNLISHLSVLQNVELAMSLSGVGYETRKARAVEVLEKVGLGDQCNKYPNQLSGGQMQRVAIARALVNDPEILLADEPTGALDSKTSVQVMELLKEIATERAVIMVTHNAELAAAYSTRIVSLMDGEIVTDSAPYEPEDDKACSVECEESSTAVCAATDEKPETAVENKNGKLKTSMSFGTALALSLRNLFTKKGRTFITAFAGSIGIIGIALVLAFSNGINSYIKNIEEDFMAESAMSIERVSVDYSFIYDTFSNSEVAAQQAATFPDDENVGVFKSEVSNVMVNAVTHNELNDNFVTFLEKNLSNDIYKTIEYEYDVAFNVIRGNAGSYKVEASENFSQMITNEAFVRENYDLLAGNIDYNDKFKVYLVIDANNKIDAKVLEMLGYDTEQNNLSVSFSELLTKSLRIAYNDTCYEATGSRFQLKGPISNSDFADDNLSFSLNIGGILRIKNSAEASPLMFKGIYYNPSLATYLIEKESTSAVVLAQNELMRTSAIQLNGATYYKSILDEYYITDLEMFNPDMIAGDQLSHLAISFSNYRLGTVNADTRLARIKIYPTDFNAKQQILEVISDYNSTLPVDSTAKITYTDAMKLAFDMLAETTDIVTYALIAFVAISLLVSTVMIGVITYVSVIERTKEIGILRAIGARKKDISRVFNAETFIVGAAAGIIGIIVAYLITIPASLILESITDIAWLCKLNPLHACILIVISIALTLISGLVPSRLAAKKDPIECLRSE